MKAHQRTIITWISVALIVAGCGSGGSASLSSQTNPPASLSYPSTSLTFVVGTAITPVVPTASQGLTSFTVTPALPAGVSLNASTGTISGTPASASGATTYTVMASGAGASASAIVSITVNPAPPSSLSYGASAFTFTANVAAQTLTPTAEGGVVAAWSIDPSLPAGLNFDTTNGVISGTPTSASAPASYVVTAQNAGGKATLTLTIEVDSGVLLDLGHDTQISLLRMSAASVLSVDGSGHWNLWDYASASQIANGDLYCAPVCSGSHLADMAGATVALTTAKGFEILSATTGQVLSNISASVSWWSLASDGSYLVAGSSTGLFAWSPTGDSLVALAGDYSKALAFAGPGQIQLAKGPAGQTVIQTTAVPGGATTTGPAFNGQFSSWFIDGSRFITSAGSTALVYSQSSVQQAAIALPTGSEPAVGQGNWLWTVAAGTVDVFAIASGSTPAASFTVGVASDLIPSATTIAVIANGTDLSVIDLSGATPTMASYTLPIVGYQPNYAALSASQWMIGNGWGVLLDGASLAATPRYFDYGAAWSIAGSSGSIAVATASGRIVYFDASSLTQEGVIPFSASNVLLSSDGSLLAAAGDENDSQYNDDWSIRIYSLPDAGLLYTWPYSFSSGVRPQYMSLSGSGTVLGQTIFSASACTQQVSSPTGGSVTTLSTPCASINSCGDLNIPAPSPILVSPDGSLDATGTSPASCAPNPSPGTNSYQNGTFATAVTGLPIGWIDDGHLLANTYKLLNGNGPPVYAACQVYSPTTGQSSGPCALPEVTAFQTVTPDTIYAVNLAAILSVSTGNIDWKSGDAASPLLGPLVGAVADNRVVFSSGPRILAQGY